MQLEDLARRMGVRTPEEARREAMDEEGRDAFEGFSGGPPESAGGVRWAGGSVRHPSTGRPLGLDDFFVEVKDQRNRLHSFRGAPGRKWSDGFEEFFWHGVRVPEAVARYPERITIRDIDIEGNAEVRRVMIERYGTQRYMKDCGATLLHQDKTGELYIKHMGQQQESMVFVKVRNSTAEPDGSFKDYYLRVPPTMRKAIDAVAWTFGMNAKTYAPSVET